MTVIIISVTNFIIIHRTINHARYNYQCNQLVQLFAEQSTRPVIIINEPNFIIIYGPINHARYNNQRN